MNASEEKKKPKAEKSAPSETARANVSQDLAALLEGLPAKDPAEALPIVKALIEKGPAAVAVLVEAVGPKFGDPAGVKPAYAVHGLVHYASRPGADAERKMVAATLAKSLETAISPDLRAFVCQQLQLCGGAEEVPALAKLLGDEHLAEPATQALTAIGGELSAAALRQALTEAKGKRRATLLNALGRFRDVASAAEARKSLADADADLRTVARYALGNAGDAASADALLKAADGEPSYERTQAFDACLRLARSLGRAGNSAAAETFLRQVAEKRKTPEDVSDRCALLETLCAVLGSKAVPDMLAALASADLKYRAAAARIAVDLAASISKAEPAETKKLLGQVLGATKEESVRQAARRLLAKAGT
jgi:hypothetical protein